MAKRAVRSQAQPKAARTAQAPGSNGGSSGDLHLEQAPNEDDIRVRAYHRYLARGAGHGNDFDDWVEAERDLKVAHN